MDRQQNLVRATDWQEWICRREGYGFTRVCWLTQTYQGPPRLMEGVGKGQSNIDEILIVVRLS